jgi:hypothetical protein
MIRELSIGLIFLNLLKFLIYNQIILLSNKKPDAVINLLSRHVNGKNSFFEGMVYGYSFDIERRLGWFKRNSFVPVIKGDVKEHQGGSEIKITTRLNLLVIAFIMGWSGGILYIILKNIIVNHNFVPVFLLGILGIVWLFLWQIYDGEVTQAIVFIKRML